MCCYTHKSWSSAHKSCTLHTRAGPLHTRPGFCTLFLMCRKVTKMHHNTIYIIDFFSRVERAVATPVPSAVRFVRFRGSFTCGALSRVVSEVIHQCELLSVFLSQTSKACLSSKKSHYHPKKSKFSLKSQKKIRFFFFFLGFILLQKC